MRYVTACPSDLEEPYHFTTRMGFDINPYDWFVPNKTINGKQRTVVLHVDDLQVSHVDSSVLSDFL